MAEDGNTRRGLTIPVGWDGGQPGDIPALVRLSYAPSGFIYFMSSVKTRKENRIYIDFNIKVLSFVRIKVTSKCPLFNTDFFS